MLSLANMMKNNSTNNLSRFVEESWLEKWVSAEESVSALGTELAENIRHFFGSIDRLERVWIEKRRGPSATPDASLQSRSISLQGLVGLFFMQLNASHIISLPACPT